MLYKVNISYVSNKLVFLVTSRNGDTKIMQLRITNGPPSKKNQEEPIQPVQMDSSQNNTYTAQKMKFYINDFFIKCDQIRRKLRIWSHLLKNS